MKYHAETATGHTSVRQAGHSRNDSKSTDMQFKRPTWTTASQPTPGTNNIRSTGTRRRWRCSSNASGNTRYSKPSVSRRQRKTITKTAVWMWTKYAHPSSAVTHTHTLGNHPVTNIIFAYVYTTLRYISCLPHAFLTVHAIHAHAHVFQLEHFISILWPHPQKSSFLFMWTPSSVLSWVVASGWVSCSPAEDGPRTETF